MHPKDAEGIANSVDPEEQSDLGLHCLPMPICPKLRIIAVYLVHCTLPSYQSKNLQLTRHNQSVFSALLFLYSANIKFACPHHKPSNFQAVWNWAILRYSPAVFHS